MTPCATITSLEWSSLLDWCTTLCPSWLLYSFINALSPCCALVSQDYVDELLVNLHHNIEINRKPRIVAGQDSLLSPDRETTEDGVPCFDHPPRHRLGVRETGGDETSASVDQASPELCVSLHPSSPPCKDDAPVLESSWLEPERCGLPNLNSSEICENLSSASADTIGGYVSLQPLQRMSVCKVDWNAYTARHPAGDNFRQDEGRSKFWWDDEGPRAGGSGKFSLRGRRARI